MNVAVLGASANPARYSHKAVQALMAGGHRVFPVHPALATLLGNPVYPALATIPEPLHTITVYLSPAHQGRVGEAMLRCGPQRVIFNPGAENPVLAARLNAAGIEALNACTLVLLSTGQFAV
jgi:predicted CoA-binding protein